MVKLVPMKVQEFCGRSLYMFLVSLSFLVLSTAVAQVLLGCLMGMVLLLLLMQMGTSMCMKRQVMYINKQFSVSLKVM